MPDLRLRVGGHEYVGWKDIAVTTGLDSIAGRFSLSVSERWSLNGQRWTIREDDACAVAIDDTTLITGYVDRRRMALAVGEHSFGVEGRDVTGNLVDCSAVLKQWEFANMPVLDLCRLVAKPFGITVSLQPGLVDKAIGTATPTRGTAKPRAGGSPSGVGSAGRAHAQELGHPNAKFTINPGDSAWEVIDRSCRMVGVLAVSDGLGGVLLTRAGSLRATTALVEGENILQASADYDNSRRYREYLVRGQASTSILGDAQVAAGVSGSAQDLGAREGRVLLIRPEGQVTTAFARRRAEWEATTRAARSSEIDVVVQGWTQGDGALWPLNALVDVRLPSLHVDAEMLIVQRTFRKSDAGTLTQLHLMRGDAFLPEPTLAPTGGSNVLAGILGNG